MINIDKIDGAITVLSANDKFSGCIFLNDENANTSYTFSCGYACKEYKVPNKTDTKFNIASVGKPITGVAITMLTRDGFIDLSKVVSEYIDLKNDVFNHITIEQLLTHTSGLGDYFQAAYNSPYIKSYEDFKDFLDIVENASLDFAPGDHWSYSNLGYLVLGLLIEKVSGMSYYTYIQQNIFLPSNMTDSGFWLYNEPVSNRAFGYSYDDERRIWRNRFITPVLRGTSAGGWFSTVGDLSKFMKSMLSHKLLSSYYTNLVITPKPELNAPNYGYGFFVSDAKLSHGGNGTGIGAHLSYYKSNGYTLAVLSNYSSGVDDVVSIFDAVLL